MKQKDYVLALTIAATTAGCADTSPDASAPLTPVPAVNAPHVLAHNASTHRAQSVSNGSLSAHVSHVKHVMVNIPKLLGLPADKAKAALGTIGYHIDDDGGHGAGSTAPNGEQSTWYINRRSTMLWVEVDDQGIVNGVGIDWEVDQSFSYKADDFANAFGRVGIDVTQKPDERFSGRWVWDNINGRKLEIMSDDGKVFQVQVHTAG